MTSIHQNALANHPSINDASHHSENRNIGSAPHDRQIPDDSTRDLTSGTVNISFHAYMRLRAYQDEKTQLTADSELMPVNSLAAPVNSQPDSISEQDSNVIDNRFDKSSMLLKITNLTGFSEQMINMLSEVENNIVQSSEPGYRYLVNMLNNFKTIIEDPQQLQEIMRKEEFYLSRRKPFMESADFQSYSQVLSQFSNIIERQ